MTLLYRFFAQLIVVYRVKIHKFRRLQGLAYQCNKMCFKLIFLTMHLQSQE